MGGILSYLPPYSIVQPRSDIGPCAAILCPPLASTAMLSLFGLRTLSVDPAGLCPAEETGFPLASSRTVRSPSYHFLPLNLRSCRPTPYPVQTWSGGGGSSCENTLDALPPFLGRTYVRAGCCSRTGLVGPSPPYIATNYLRPLPDQNGQ